VVFSVVCLPGTCGNGSLVDNPDAPLVDNGGLVVGGAGVGSPLIQAKSHCCRYSFSGDSVAAGFAVVPGVKVVILFADVVAAIFVVTVVKTSAAIVVISFVVTVVGGSVTFSSPEPAASWPEPSPDPEPSPLAELSADPSPSPESS